MVVCFATMASMEEAAPQPKKTRIPNVLTHVDENILTAIYWYYYMPVLQIVKALGYSINSLPTVRTRLASLEKRGYIAAIYLPTVRKGNFPKIFYLAAKGLAHLRDDGHDVAHRFHSTEQKEKQYLFLKHTMAVNDVLIAAKQVEKQFPQVTLYEFRHERELKRDPEKFTITLYHETESDTEEAKVWKQEEFYFVPDAFLDFRLEQENKTLRAAILLELDRDTTERRRFQEKIRGILTYLKSDRHVKRYKARKITVAFVTTGTQKRVEKMRDWTRNELAKTHDTWDYGHTFVFTALPHKIDPDTQRELDELDDIDPATLFLSPVWEFPFTDKKGNKKVAILAPEPL
jgi:Replication-relaxation